MYKKTALLFCLILVFAGACVTVAHGQMQANGSAIGIQINDTHEEGDIISTVKGGYKRSTSAYDPQVFGVVSYKPALYFKDITATNDVPIISAGEVEVRVSNQNGNINAGDLITSSTNPGVGQLATDNGFVLGQADQSFSSNDPKKVGLILVTLQPHYAQLSNNLVHNVYSTFTFGFSQAATSPLGIIRYFAAAGVTLLSFFFGFRFFARASNRGVEAIGRNPLARQAILFSVMINTVVTIAIMFFGVALSYLILVL